jgi:phosphate starvation-inducible PhoH-like protein
MSKKQSLNRKQAQETQQETQQEVKQFRMIRPKNPNQKLFQDSIAVNPITVANGPAGTGKTLIAVNKACDMMQSGQVSNIILMRPYVPALEEYGFLPGDMDLKFGPYLVPYIDYLNDRLGKATVINFLKSGKIRAEPIGFMQGKTFDRSVMLLDEAANGTLEQLKLILTRMGLGTHCVFMGDLAQNYSPKSGFAVGMDIINTIPGAKTVNFTIADCVRSSTCKDVLEAFEAFEKPKLKLVHNTVQHVSV